MSFGRCRSNLEHRPCRSLPEQPSLKFARAARGLILESLRYQLAYLAGRPANKSTDSVPHSGRRRSASWSCRCSSSPRARQSRGATSSSSPRRSATRTPAPPTPALPTSFFAWCRGARSHPAAHRAHAVAAYVERLRPGAPPPGQAAPRGRPHAVRLARHRPGRTANPAARSRAPSTSSTKGKTRVPTRDEAKALLDGIPADSVIGLRDRALIATLVYTFARISAALAMKVEDYYPVGKRWWVRLHEKGGKSHAVRPTTPLQATSTPTSRPPASPRTARAPLFRSAAGRTGRLTTRRWPRRRPHDRRGGPSAAGLATGLAATRSGRAASPPTSRMAACSSTRSGWPRIRPPAPQALRPARRGRLHGRGRKNLAVGTTHLVDLAICA